MSRSATTPDPDRPSAVEEAMAHHRAGRPQRAAQLCRAVLDAEPEHPLALQLLGVLQLQAGEAERSAATLRHLLELHPCAAGALLPLGEALATLGDAVGAEAAYRRLLERAPDLPEAHYALGRLLSAAGRAGEAAGPLRRAVELRPAWPEAVNELGVAHLRGVGGPPDGAAAAELFRRAAELAPDWAVPAHNLGEALEAGGDPAAAVAAYEAVLGRWPGFEPARRNLAYGLLKLGRFEPGWREHEWRLGAGGRTPGRDGWEQDVWDGAPFPGRTLVVWTEQGLGDHLQFVRYLPAVAALGGRVWMQAPAPLARLMTSCRGVDRVVVGDPPAAEVDLQVPLLSLPRILGTTLENLPAEVPYVWPPEAPSAASRAALAAAGGRLRVGLVWRSGVLAPRHAERDLGAPEVRRLLAVPGVRWLSLQHGESVGGLLPGEAAAEVADLGPEIGDFAATAAVVAELDLVVSVDTATLHLAGALGRPVWGLVSEPGDWRWLIDRDDSPWYPTLRLFRQRRRGDWGEAVERLAAALEEHAAAGRGRPRRGAVVEIPGP
jgi:tetratricopeptide (TPR) repeat protein